MKRILFAAVLLLSTAATGSAQDIPLSQILVEGEGWHVVVNDRPAIVFLGGYPNGSVWVGTEKSTHILSKEGKLTANEPGALLEGPTSQPQFWEKLSAAPGRYFVIDPAQNSLELCKLSPIMVGPYRLELHTTKLKGLIRPNCLKLWVGESQLVIGDAGSKYLWTARVDRDGKLGTPDCYYSLRVKPGEKGSGVTAMVMDARNLLYAATPLGVQVFDPTGRLCGVINPPAKEEMTAITIGGKDADTLYVACGDKIYSRKIQGKATYTLKKEK